jgi:hypothetical protein
LEELARDKRVRALLRHAALSGHPEKLLGATVGFVGASEADLPQLLGGVVGVGVTALGSAIKRHADLSVEQRRSAYFFLYELERQARKRRKD